VALPAGPFDLVYLGNVYHIYGPRTNSELTRRVFGKLTQGGVIAIRDLVYERSPRSALFAVNMLQATDEGGVWTGPSIAEWLNDAGFAKIEVLDLGRPGPSWSSPESRARGQTTNTGAHTALPKAGTGERMERCLLRDDIWWVSAIDWDVRDFHGYETPRGTTVQRLS
jgi:hypothetical protein